MIVKGKIFLLFTGLVVILVYSCKKPLNNDKGRIIAETKDKVLLESELQKVYPYESIDAKDSIQFVSNYIIKWIKQQLLVSEAEKNLSAEDLDLHLELEKYRQELLIHKFKQLKSEQLLRKTISAKHIENYYNKNLHLFLLNNSIVQVKYIIFPIEVNLSNKFKRQLSSTKEIDVVNAEDFIFKYAKKYDDFNKNWIYFDFIKELAKIEIEDETRFLKKEKLIEFTNESEIHIIAINQYKLQGEQAPLEFVKPQIKSLIINSKKLDFLREIKDSLYNDALKYNKFRVLN